MVFRKAARLPAIKQMISNLCITNNDNDDGDDTNHIYIYI